MLGHLARPVVDEVLDEIRTADAAIDAFAELGIERDRPIQQQRRDWLVLEFARNCKRPGYGIRNVFVLLERRADRVAVAERGMEPESSTRATSTR